MRFATIMLTCLLAISACGQAQPVAEKERITDTGARADVLPVMGQERRVAVLAAGILDGSGLGEEERYASRLESALRARGVNARVLPVRSASQAAAAKVELLVMAASDDVLAQVPTLVPRMQVPEVLLQPDGRRPVAQGVEELVAQSAGQVAAALPELR